MDPITLRGHQPSLSDVERFDGGINSGEERSKRRRRRTGDTAPLGAIFSPGRSGSTWLGSMVSSHPDVAYRFEPVLRLRDIDVDVAALDDRLQHGGVATSAELHEVFRLPDPLVAKPPFVASTSWSPVPALKGMAWALAKTGAPKSDALFQRCLSPGKDARIVFKEVERLHLVRAVAQMPEVPIVYMLRHPASVVASRLKGISAGLMPSVSRESVAALLRNRPDLARELAVDELNVVQLEALAWRLQTDAALSILGEHPEVRVVFYEALVREPETGVGAVLEHLGFEPSATTNDFIALSQSDASTLRRLWHGELPVNGYFSVFRSGSASPWQHALGESELVELLAVVNGGAATALAADAGEWEPE